MSYASVGGSRHTKENHRIYYKLRGDSDAPIKIVRRERVLKQDETHKNTMMKCTGIYNGIRRRSLHVETSN